MLHEQFLEFREIVLQNTSIAEIFITVHESECKGMTYHILLTKV